MDHTSSAPTYRIPHRDVVAVEHPMIIKNIENGLKTFGQGKSFTRILDADDPEGCLPLYLRHSDPMCAPILSHNSPTSNVLLKITVPKRTGKRKRDSQDPSVNIVPRYSPTEGVDSTQSNLRSYSRNDGTSQLLRSMRDNADNYEVEAVAEIQRTHRFRGLADYQHSTAHSEFSKRFRELVLPGDVEKMRQFKFNPSRGWQKNEQFMPPPVLTNETLPFNWGYQQNTNVVMSVDEATGKAVLTNKAKLKTTPLQFLAADAESVPQSSTYPLPDNDAERLVIRKVTEAMEERPVWTRRALGNRIGHEALPVPISRALHHVAYQFKGGPFRDAIIKHGVDPRSDPKYRKYQTLFFQIYEGERGAMKEWKDVRTGIPLSTNAVRTDILTHVFDGKTLALDGKVWQLCDITEPLLRELIDNAPLREDYDMESNGYFCNGTWAKVQAIMRTMLIAVRARIPVESLDFRAALDFPDIVENNKRESKRISVPVPDIRLADEEVQELVEEGIDVSFLQPGGTTKSNKKKKRNLRIAKAVPKRRYKRKYDIDGGKGQESNVDGGMPKESRKKKNAKPILATRDSSTGERESNQGQHGNTPSDTTKVPKAVDHGDEIEEGSDEEEDDDGVEDQEMSGENIDNGEGQNQELGGDVEEDGESDSAANILDPATYSRPQF